VVLGKSYFLQNDRNQNLLPVRTLNCFDFFTQSGQNNPKRETAIFWLFLVVFGRFWPFLAVVMCL
jgi:hypothetical protein